MGALTRAANQAIAKVDSILKKCKPCMFDENKQTQYCQNLERFKKMQELRLRQASAYSETIAHIESCKAKGGLEPFEPFNLGSLGEFRECNFAYYASKYMTADVLSKREIIAELTSNANAADNATLLKMFHWARKMVPDPQLTRGGSLDASDQHVLSRAVGLSTLFERVTEILSKRGQVVCGSGASTTHYLGSAFGPGTKTDLSVVVVPMECFVMKGYNLVELNVYRFFQVTTPFSLPQPQPQPQPIPLPPPTKRPGQRI